MIGYEMTAQVQTTSKLARLFDVKIQHARVKFSPHLQVKKLQTLWALGMLIVLEYLVLVMMEKLRLLVHSKV